MNASIRAQQNHEPKVKAVRVNGQITEVKQSMSRGSTRMGDHLFFQSSYDWQICQILLINLNFGKNSIITHAYGLAT